ncbi:hypothetical protein SADUNF_Sadunf07G0012900 [Salix dunnii]|uniref:Uncharacterized protein n=1 Tax=Salix dunnii TaxID=1413687 RepID=A0A835K2I6_9ROSI|nr:hypothetical protein SADUNF_Sadunf07G0012900 [Salix dunnii]
MIVVHGISDKYDRISLLYNVEQEKLDDNSEECGEEIKRQGQRAATLGSFVNIGFGNVKNAPELVLFSEFDLFSMVGYARDDGASQSRMPEPWPEARRLKWQWHTGCSAVSTGLSGLFLGTRFINHKTGNCSEKSGPRSGA